MSDAGRHTCTWLARICLLSIVFIFVSALFYPAGLKPLDSMVCPAGLTLDTRSDGPVRETASSSHHVVCESPERLQDVTTKVIGVMGILFVAAAGFYVLRSRITPAAMSAPRTPITH